MTKNVDIVSEIIGEWGPWQSRAVILIYLCKIPSAWFMACIIFTAPIPNPAEVACYQPEIQSEFHGGNWPMPRNITNEFDEDPKNFCFRKNRIQFTDTEGEINRDSVPCELFRFDTPFESTVTKFDLVCSRSILIATSQFFHLFGVLTGGILAVKLMET